MKSNTQRLNNIIGQIEGVKKMIDAKKDCLQIMTQLKAIKSGVAGVMDSLVEEQFDNCLQSLKTEDKELLIKIKKYVKSN